MNDAPTESEGIRGLMIAGPIVFGVAYLTGIATTVALEAEGDLIGMAAAPLVGPWIMLTEDRTADYAGALIAGGILQTAGAAMFIVGLSVRRDVVVGGERIRVELVPSMAHEGGGAYAVGSF